MRYVIGIDGGGTKTTAVLIDETGRVIREVSGGAANFQVIGLQGMIQKIVPLIITCAGEVTVDLLCIGVAGAGRWNDYEDIRKGIQNLDLVRQVVVISDAKAALMGAHGGREGIVLIAGTGSIALGMDREGKVVRSGGWGYLLGDEGSGYDIGRRAIMACLMARDRRGRRTKLSHPLLRALRMRGWNQIVRKVYGGSVRQTEIAALAPLVFDVARMGDYEAMRIVRETGMALGLLVLGVIRQLGVRRQALPLAVSGGLFKSRDLILPHILATISNGGGGELHVTDPVSPPAYGAAALGFRQIGVEIFV